jgi:hypothetical protein
MPVISHCHNAVCANHAGTETCPGETICATSEVSEQTFCDTITPVGSCVSASAITTVSGNRYNLSAKDFWSCRKIAKPEVPYTPVNHGIQALKPAYVPLRA